MTTVDLTGSGNWSVPAGVTSVVVECIGGGGGARGGTGLGAGGGGGGGGAFASSTVSVTPGGSVPYSVGTAGSGSSFGTGTGLTAGGDSSWNSGQVLAKGGSAAAATTTGAGGAGGQAANCVGTTIVGGTNGSSNSGGAGGAGGAGASGGSLTGGAGGAPGSSTSPTNAGDNGSAPGGGGGGGRNLTGGNGGNGAVGTIRLTYTVATPHGSGDSTGTASLTGTGHKVTGGTGSLTGSAILTGAGHDPTSNTGSLVGTGDLTGTGHRVTEGAGVFSADGTMSGTGHNVPTAGPVPVNDTTPGSRSWVADFTGPAVIIQWGGGGGGAAGEGFTRGGKGGGAGALAVDLIHVVYGQTYPYYNGLGGAGGAYSGTKIGADGQASYFGGGTTCRAAGGKGAGPGNTGGAGGAVEDSLGRSRVAGQDGQTRPGTLDGGPGGKAPDEGQYLGGEGGATNGQTGSNPGQAPGGGGSGGGHASGSNGGAGATGGTAIFQAADPTLPGYYLVGVDEDYNFSLAGTYDDFIPSGDGTCWFEAVGSGGGGRGGNGLAFQGGHGGSGAAWAATLRQVFRSVSYRRLIPSGGAGTALNGGVAANGADAYWTLTPLRVIQKQVSGNVATLWTCAPGSSTPQKHGLLVGEQVTITGVDATFNGTYTITAVAEDRLSFSYAKTAANSGPAAVTPAGTSVSLTSPFVLAKGGLGATGTYTGGTPQPGGQASECTGDIAHTGDRGQQTQSATTTWGGNGGGGALPLGEQGGWAGGSTYATTGSAGEPGHVPGGGGGGGRGATGGDGGNGAAGAAVVRWITELHGIWIGGQRKSVTRVKVWTGGTDHTVSEVSVFDVGAKHSTHRTMIHPESLKRRYPDYLPDNYRPFYDRATGTFNWRTGASHILPALAANSLDIVVPGDSVSEGWTSLDPITFVGTKDFPNAFPRMARDMIDVDTSATLGGTGFTRTASVSGADTQWSISGWSASGHTHYVSSSNTGHIATFTPGVTSNQSSPASHQITGTRCAVVYSGKGVVIRIDGVIVATTADTAGDGVLARWESSLLSDAAHVIDVRPVGGGTSNLFGADVYTDSGIRLHNVSQGGAKAGGGTGQSYWGDTATPAPLNMTNCYSQHVMVPSAKGVPDVVAIFLGGNDSFAGTDAATIKAAMKNIGDAFDGPNTDIVLMPDVHSADRNLALMDLCMEEGWAMIDLFYLSRALTSVFGQNYNGDPFGHLNLAGAAWVGDMMRDAFLYDPT